MVTPLVIALLIPFAGICWVVDAILQARSDRRGRRG